MVADAIMDLTNLSHAHTIPHEYSYSRHPTTSVPNFSSWQRKTELSLFDQLAGLPELLSATNCGRVDLQLLRIRLHVDCIATASSV
jgi:hypothetical protein